MTPERTWGRMRRFAPVALTLGIACAITLTGCANPIQQAVEGITQGSVERLIEEASGVDLEGFGATAEVPDDFPRQVPLPEGDPILSFRLDGDEGLAWTLTYPAAGEDAFSAYQRRLEGAGFTEASSTEIGGAMKMATYEGHGYKITAGGLQSDGQHLIQLTVNEWNQ